jgi:hypothetical protein
MGNSRNHRGDLPRLSNNVTTLDDQTDFRKSVDDAPRPFHTWLQLGREQTQREGERS